MSIRPRLDGQVIVFSRITQISYCQIGKSDWQDILANRLEDVADFPILFTLMKLALVIVSYNSYLDIENLLVSLRSQRRQPDLVIVVDNCSPNGDGKRLRDNSTEYDYHFVEAPANN